MKKTKEKKSKQEKRMDSAVTVQVLLFVIGVMLINVLPVTAYEHSMPEIMTGYAGLTAVRAQLIRYLVIRVLRVTAPALLVLLAAVTGEVIERESIRIHRGHVLCAAIACVIMYPVAFTHRTGFEIQCEKNGCRGPRPVQAISLLADVQRDISAQSAEPPQTEHLTPARENRGYAVRSRRGGHRRHTVYEYALRTDTGETLAQIGKTDWQNAEHLCAYAPHEIALYPHSGLIASFDGGDIPVLNDLETLFTLSIEGNMLSRTTHPQEASFQYFHYYVERDGEQIGQISAEKRTEQYFTTGLHTRVWLEMLYDGQLVRVSNILEF